MKTERPWRDLVEAVVEGKHMACPAQMEHAPESELAMRLIEASGDSYCGGDRMDDGLVSAA